jgi:uncharacterized protein
VRHTATADHPVIDFRARLVARPQAREKLEEVMAAAGVNRVVIGPGGIVDPDTLADHVILGGHVTADADHSAVLEAATASAGRLLPSYFGNPHTGADDYRRRAGAFCSLELSPAVHGVALTDPRHHELVEVAADHGQPVYVVCLGRPGVGAADLVALAEQHADATFVLGHCGFVGIDFHALRTVAPVPNIHAETSGCYTAIAGAAIERLGARRVLFGSEFPLQHPEVELTKIAVLRLDPAEERDVLGRNAARLLGLDIGSDGTASDGTASDGTAPDGTALEAGGRSGTRAPHTTGAPPAPVTPAPSAEPVPPAEPVPRALFAAPRVAPVLAVSLAGVGDLCLAAELGLSDGAVRALLGGGPEEIPAVYDVACPVHLLPLGVPQVVLHGTGDLDVPLEVSTRYARRAGAECDLVVLPGANHMALIDPDSAAWTSVLNALARL